MALRAEVLRAMKAAGATMEVILAAVEAEQAAERAEAFAADEARKARARDGNRERQARFRAKHGDVTDVTHGNGVTHRDSVTGESKESPQTPIETTLPSDPPTGGLSEASAVAAAVTPAVTDPRKDLFDRGVPAIRRMTGRADPGCRSLLGRWLGLAQDSAVTVMTVIDSAIEAEVVSPIPWIEKSIRNEVQRNGSGSHDLFRGGSSGNRPSGTVNAAVSAAVARHADRRGLRSGGGPDGGRPREPEDRRPRRDDSSIEDADWTPTGRYHAAH